MNKLELIDFISDRFYYVDSLGYINCPIKLSARGTLVDPLRVWYGCELFTINPSKYLINHASCNFQLEPRPYIYLEIGSPFNISLARWLLRQKQDILEALNHDEATSNLLLNFLMNDFDPDAEIILK